MDITPRNAQNQLMSIDVANTAAQVAVRGLEILIPIAGLTAALIAIISGLNRGRLQLGKLSAEFTREDAQKFKDNIDKNTAKGISLTASLMSEYHAQSLSQSKASFRLSLIFASLGFAIIALSIGLFLQQNPNPSAGWTDTAGKPLFTLVAGIVVEAVSALFFVQSNKSRELMSEFFDKLRNDRKIDEAITFTKEINDTDIGNRLKAIIALSFADAGSNDLTLRCLIDPKAAIDLQSNKLVEPIDKTR